jgi:polyhydroxybutyrate depolymerase
VNPAAPPRLEVGHSGLDRHRPSRRVWAAGAALLLAVAGAAIAFVALRGPHAALNLVRHDTVTPAGLSSVSRPSPIVERPPGLSGKLPLVVALYGAGGCPQCMEGVTNLESLARQDGFVVAYPGSTTDPPWNSPSDLSYVSSFIDGVIASDNIDPQRVYLTGFSAGGRATYEYGCALSDKLAAIAIVSSVMRSYACPLHHPLSELAIVGSTEHTALYGNANGIPSAGATAARWRSRDGCPATGVASMSTAGLAGVVQRQQWGPCVDGSQVGLFVLAGGYHTWPGTSSAHFPDTGYNASQAIWQFFAPLRAASLTTPDATLARATAKGKRVSATLKLGERVTVRASLRRGGRTLAALNRQLPAGAAVPFSLTGSGKGPARLTLVIRDGYGRSRTIVRSVRLR